MTDDDTRRVDGPSGEPPPGTSDPVPAAGPPTPASQPFPAIQASDASAPAGAASAPAAAPAPASTAPVHGPGTSRARWIVALGVAALAIAVGIGGFFLLGARPTPEALRYIPAGSVAVAEVRLDLPGDQMQKLGNLLSKFPGFADQSTLIDKIDEAFSQAIGSASGGGVDYRTDIKPWLNGPAFISVQPPPAGSLEEGVPLVSATTNGAVDCATTLGVGATRETYRGLELVIASDALDSGMACVVDGRQALFGEPAAVKAGLDAKANASGMDKDGTYAAARAALTGDQLLTVFINGDAIEGAMPVPSFGDLPVPSGFPVPGFGGLGDLAGAVPDWAIIGVRAEDDALVVDTVAAPLPTPTAGPSLLPVPPAHPSVLASMVPADTLLLVEDQGTGVSLQNLLTILREDPDLGPALGMLEGLGGADELVGWIQDAGIVVVPGAAAPTGGVLLVAADDAAANDRVATLRNLLAFAGLSGGIEVRDATVAGVNVTTVVITDLGSLVPPGSLPDGAELPADARIEFSIATKGRVILIGVGEGFMNGVLNVQPGTSLADQASYRSAQAHSLTTSRTSMYVNVRGAIDLVEDFLPADARAEWEADIKPYVAPIDAVAASLISDASGSRSRLIITVSQPQ